VRSQASLFAEIIDGLAKAYFRAKQAGQDHLAQLIAAALVETIALEVALRIEAGSPPHSK
jgi:hypothetical protein